MTIIRDFKECKTSLQARALGDLCYAARIGAETLCVQQVSYGFIVAYSGANTTYLQAAEFTMQDRVRYYKSLNRAVAQLKRFCKQLGYTLDETVHMMKGHTHD